MRGILSIGLATLLEAMELQLNARSVRDLDDCVARCEEALEQGLSPADAELAHNIAASCLYQRASSISSVIVGREQPHPRWPQLRDIAMNDLERAVKHFPDLAEAQMLICKLQLLPEGNRERGLEAANEAIRLYVDDRAQLAEAYLNRARFQEDTEKQLADIRLAKETDPQNLEIQRMLAQLLFEQSQFTEAADAIREMLKQEGENAELHLALAEALANIEGQDEEAMQEIDRALQIQPQLPQAYLLRSRMHVNKNDIEAAIADASEALKIDANDVAARLYRAELHLFRDEIPAARADIEEVLRQRPGLVLGILMRSRLNAAEKKYEEAIRDMEMLVQNDPLNTDYRLQLAAFYTADDRPRKAISVLGEVIENDENNWRALRSRADARLAIGEHAKAIDDYNKALEINPEESGILNNLSWVLSTSPEDDLRNGGRALELAKKAAELTEYKEAHILSTLASAYAEMGDFETAIKWSTKAVELGEGEVKEQLQAELKSYEEKKPWREKQETKEKPDVPKRNLLET
jgi:tetratricopeptide (TPR) repeat protein